MWTDDLGFDLDWHVHQASLPAPGGEAELGPFVGREFSHRLDRSRPLWEATVIEGMQGGRQGLMMKVHHALVDGMAAIGMAALGRPAQPGQPGPHGGDHQPRRHPVLRPARRPRTRPPLSVAAAGLVAALDELQ